MKAQYVIGKLFESALMGVVIGVLIKLSIDEDRRRTDAQVDALQKQIDTLRAEVDESRERGTYR